MYEKHVVGKLGEEIAEKYLTQNNYKIIEKNFSCSFGEIDIIAKDEEEIVIIEVKTRTNKNYGLPIDSVTKIKQKHMKKVAEFYLNIRGFENENIRIDVIEIYIKNNKCYVHHIKQIW